MRKVFKVEGFGVCMGSFFGRLSVRGGDDKLDAREIRRGVNVFSCICGDFVFLVIG